MILRTPLQRKRRAESVTDLDAPPSDRRLVIYEDDPLPVSSVEPSDQLVCTYHCRQMVKSEFMVALDTAEKQLVDYQTRQEKLTNELCKSEEERKIYRDKLCYVEQEVEAFKGREHALQERVLKEVDDSQQRYQTQLKRCSELEVMLKKEVDSRKVAESLAASAKEKAADLEDKLQRLSGTSEKEKNRLLKELSHLQDESKLTASRIYADFERIKIRAENSEKETDLLKGQLVDLREQLNEIINQKSEVEHRLSRLIATSHEKVSPESQALVKHLQEELRNCEAEVNEARRLKSSYMTNELLKEKLLEEKTRRERTELELSKLQAVELNAQKIEHELMSWKSLLKDIPDVSCFEDIPKKFGGLQKENIESMRKAGEISAHMKKLEVALEIADLGRQHAEKECELAKEKAENLALEVKRLEPLLTSVTEERQRKSRLADYALTNESLVADMESSLLEKENCIKVLESNLHEQKEILNRQYGELKIMNDRLSAEASRIKSLEREDNRLRSEISLLESKLGHGDYTAANTKVLRMVNTLAVDNDAKHTIEALRDELKKTQSKLQAVEELKGQSAAGSILDADVPEKLAQLKGQIANLEKREERYKAVFAERISVFRRACCALFGYKIVMDDQQRPNGIPVTRFMLQSIYAQSDDEKLEFDYESGNTNILINDYTSQPEISRQVEIFIKKMSSIPAFTANLTIESFNKRTLS